MTSQNIITIFTAILGSSVVVALINFYQTRRKSKAEGTVAEATAPSQIALVSIQELEGKLNYLTRIIEALERTNLRLEQDVDDQLGINGKLTDRVKELTNRCDQLEAAVRKLCLENELDYRKFLD